MPGFKPGSPACQRFTLTTRLNPHPEKEPREDRENRKSTGDREDRENTGLPTLTAVGALDKVTRVPAAS
jgi:hypothetical protein